MELAKYNIDTGQHKGRRVIWIQFPFSISLKKELKQAFPTARWSQSKKSWHLPDFKSIRERLNIPIKEYGEKIFCKIHPNNQQAYVSMLDQLKLKSYSQNTIKVYLSEFAHLLIMLDQYPVKDLSPERLKDYFLFCVKKLKMKERKMNGKINAIKFYFEQVLHQPKMLFDIPRPKKPPSLPKMLSKREIKKLFNQVKNVKHLLGLKLCYGMGLRVSELQNLKINHIDSSRMQVLIEGAKGKKDRYVNLPETILPLLREYYQKYKPKQWLFEGPYGNAYSKSSFQKIFKRALKNAEINKPVGIHGLRHSYATHLIESGTNIRFIQELLGHHSIRTTQVYTHISNASKIKSPLDKL